VFLLLLLYIYSIMAEVTTKALKKKPKTRQRRSIIEEIFDRSSPPVTRSRTSNKNKKSTNSNSANVVVEHCYDGGGGRGGTHGDDKIKHKKKKLSLSQKKKNKKPAFLECNSAAALMKFKVAKKNDKKRKRDEDEEEEDNKPPAAGGAKKTANSKKKNKKDNKNKPYKSSQKRSKATNIGLPNLLHLPHKRIPWNDNATYEERVVDLEREIIQFASYVRLDHTEEIARTDFVHKVTTVLRKLRPHATINVFGSFATPAVCNYVSDLDLVITNAFHAPAMFLPALPLVEEENTKRKATTTPMTTTTKQRQEPVVVNASLPRKQAWLSALAAVDSPNEQEATNIGGGGGGGTASDPFIVMASDDDDDDDDDTADPLKRDHSDSMDSTNLTFSINTTTTTTFASGGRTTMMTTTSSAVAAVCRKSQFLQRCQVKDFLEALRPRLKQNIKTVKGVQLIGAARVPILKISTSFGLDVDICLQEGQVTDTRLFAADCVQRYGDRFSHVILVLKILLHQQRLDIPFEGGLGSYKLYALLSRYLSLEHTATTTTNRDGPKSVVGLLIGFFRSFVQYRCRIYTFDLQHHSDRGHTEVDLTAVHRLNDIVSLFLACEKRLGEYEHLGAILDVTKLAGDRERYRQLCSTVVSSRAANAAVNANADLLSGVFVEGVVAVKRRPLRHGWAL
jgi:hypothetical protein